MAGAVAASTAVAATDTDAAPMATDVELMRVAEPMRAVPAATLAEWHADTLVERAVRPRQPVADSAAAHAVASAAAAMPVDSAVADTQVAAAMAAADTGKSG
jgi:hypothetical protein